MKKIFAILSLTIVFTASCTKDEGDDFEPPYSDNVFEEITDPVLLEYCRQFDTNGDGTLSMEEALQVETISWSYYKEPIKSLEGLEYFHNLKRIDIWSCQLEHVDLRKCKNLEEVTFTKNELISLNVSGLEKLGELNCTDNSDFETLDFRGCKALTSLSIDDEKMVYLFPETECRYEGLKCTSRFWNILNKDNVEKLGFLDITMKDGSSLDITSATNLQYLRIGSGRELDLNLSEHKRLKYIGVSGALMNLKIQKSSSLEILIVYTTSYKNSLEVSDCEILNDIRIEGSGRQLQKISLDNLPSLQNFIATNCYLREITLNNLPKLEYCNLENNEIKSINLSTLPELENMGLSNNLIEELDISSNQNLRGLWIENNPLETVWVWEGFDLSQISFTVDDPPVFKVKN